MVTRWAHNPEMPGSIPGAATNNTMFRSTNWLGRNPFKVVRRNLLAGSSPVRNTTVQVYITKILAQMSSLKEKRKRIQFVYKTINLLNGTYYIGVHSTWNIDDGYLGSGKRLKRSINKYGKENFKKEILAFFETNKEAYEYEAHLVNEELIKDELCLNLKPGGRGGFCNEKHKLNFTKSSGSKKFMERYNNDELFRLKHCEISSNNFKKAHTEGKIKYNTFKDKKHSEETKSKIREKAKEKIGDINSQFGTCWITNGSSNMKINKNESIPEGWSLGRKIK